MSSAWRYFVQKLDEGEKYREKCKFPQNSDLNAYYLSKFKVDRIFLIAVSDRLLAMAENTHPAKPPTAARPCRKYKALAMAENTLHKQPLELACNFHYFARTSNTVGAFG